MMISEYDRIVDHHDTQIDLMPLESLLRIELVIARALGNQRQLCKNDKINDERRLLLRSIGFFEQHRQQL